MKSALPAPTKAEARRFIAIKLDVGCIACWIEHEVYTPCEIHHLLDTGRRRGHSYSIGLCHPHHQGADGIHRAKRAFRKAYGTDDELLEITNKRIDELA